MEEYGATLRHYISRLQRGGVEQRLGAVATSEQLAEGGFDHVVVATGVQPRPLVVPGADLPGVLSYIDVIEGRVTPGARVAIIGAGGVGFDVAELLTHEELDSADARGHFAVTWGVDFSVQARGGLMAAAAAASLRQVWLLQRKDESVGKRLGKTTGWIRRALMGRRGVQLWAGCSYERIEQRGAMLVLQLTVRGEPRELVVDSIVVCAGQDPKNELLAALAAAGVAATAIGGARVAAELDATRAIDEGTRLAAAL